MTRLVSVVQKASIVQRASGVHKQGEAVATERTGNQAGRTLPPSTAIRRRLLAFAVGRPTGSPLRRLSITLAIVVGAGLVVATAVIHLHLWATGYRDVPTIGPLFLAQGVAGLAIAGLLIATRRLVVVGLATGFMIASIGGLVVSITVGLFGFTDSLAAPDAGLALTVEAVGSLVLAGVGLVLLLDQVRARRTD